MAIHELRRTSKVFGIVTAYSSKTEDNDNNDNEKLR